MTGHDRIKLGYSFEPPPHRLRVLRHDRKIDDQDFGIVSYIYGRSNFKRLARREPTPELTLAQIREGVRWGKSDDALSKQLRRMRALGLLDWTFPKRGVYLFTLYPDMPEGSEDVPSSGEPSVPSSSDTESQSESGSSGPDGHECSEFEVEVESDFVPSYPRFVPSSGRPGNVDGERNPSGGDGSAVPSCSEVQNTPKAGSEEVDQRAREETKNKEEVDDYGFRRTSAEKHPQSPDALRRKLSERDALREEIGPERMHEVDAAVEAQKRGGGQLMSGQQLGLCPDVLEAVNRGRVERGAPPLRDAGPSFHDPIGDADTALLDTVADGVFRLSSRPNTDVGSQPTVLIRASGADLERPGMSRKPMTEQRHGQPYEHRRTAATGHTPDTTAIAGQPPIANRAVDAEAPRASAAVFPAEPYVDDADAARASVDA